MSLVVLVGLVSNASAVVQIDENWDDGNWDGGATPLTWITGVSTTIDTVSGKGRITNDLYRAGRSTGISNVSFNLSSDLPIRVKLDVVTSNNGADDPRFRLTITDVQPTQASMDTYPDDASQMPGHHLLYIRARAGTLYLETVVNGSGLGDYSALWDGSPFDIDFTINSFTGADNVTVVAPSALAGTYTINFAGDGFNASADYYLVLFTYNRNNNPSNVTFDNLQVESSEVTPQQKAWSPNPVNYGVGVHPYAVLKWKPGENAVWHDVYLGTDFNDVNDANTTLTLDVYKGRQNLDANSYNASGLEFARTYYWRIDEVNDSNTWKGNIWRFTTVPSPPLQWVLIGTHTVAPGQNNWCFNPAEYQGDIFVPTGDYGTCVVHRWDGLSWYDDFLDDDWGNGSEFENLAYLQVYDSNLYMFNESNIGIMVRDSAGNWSVSHTYVDMGGGLMEFGSFGAAIFGGNLYTGVNPYPPGPLRIYRFDGSNWSVIKQFDTGEQLRAWSLGSDGSALYVGIGNRARYNNSTLGIERYDGSIWTQELSGKAMHSMAYYDGAMYAGGNGAIYKRDPSGNWNVVYNTGQSYVVSMGVVNFANGAAGVLYAGTEGNPRLYSTSDGVNWALVRNFGTSVGPCYVGQYQSTPVVSVCYYELSNKPVEIWRGHMACDFNQDGHINLLDFAVLAGQWQQAPGRLSADIAPDGGDEIVDFLDLAMLVDNWLWDEIEDSS